MEENLTQYEYPQETPKETVGAKPVEQPKESSKEKENNLRLLRERAELAERKALELENQVKQIKQKQDIDDESFVEGKEYKKLRQDVEQMRQERELERQQNAVDKLRLNFPDIDNVVTTENLNKLAEKYPADYQLIANNENVYQKGSVAYNMIKNYGIINKYAAEDKKIADNLKKPVSGAALDGQTADNPLTRVGDYDRRVLTEDRKAQLRRQVEEAKRNGG